MTFIKDYYRTLVPDWHDYYINLEYLNEELERIEKLLRVKRTQSEEPPAETAQTFAVRRLQKDFSYIFEGEIIKFCGFFKLNFNRTIRPKLVQLRLNIHHYGLIADTRKKREAYFAVKRAVLMYYKELHHFIRYIDSNAECIEVLCGVYKKIFVGLEGYDPAVVSKIYASLRESFPMVKKPELERIAKTVSNSYLDFCAKDDYDANREELHAASRDRRLNGPQLVITGVFIGIFALSCCIVAFLLYELNFFSSNAGNFATFSFPIFRGMLLAFLYVLAMGVCVYVWERYNINYRRPFELFEGNSKPYEVFRTAFGFLSLWMIVFIYCGLAASASKSPGLRAFFRPTVANWLPPCLYLLVVLYALLPSSRAMHGAMRTYIAHTLAGVLLFPFKKLSFREKFAVSQMGSFKPFFRDLAYTLCYTQNLLHSGRQDNNCANTRTYLYFEVMLTLVPLIISATQTVRELCFDKVPIHGKLYAFIGLALSLATSFRPNFFTSNFSLKVFLYLLLALNTLWAYYDDVIDSWRLLQPGSVHPLLRDVLALPHLGFYYFALVSNLFLRFFWTLSLLPLRFLKNQTIENLFGLFSVLLDTFRRAMANIIKVEVKHWEGVGNFNVVQQLPLPFFERLEEVVRRETFEQEYRQALYREDNCEMDRTQNIGAEPYEDLHHSFSEEELREFAKKRNLQLIKKSEKLGKALNKIRNEPRQKARVVGGRRRTSIHKWNDDLNLSLSNMFTIQRGNTLQTYRHNSLNRSLPDADVPEERVQPSLSRLRIGIPIKKLNS